jgi:hypothetical protein
MHDIMSAQILRATRIHGTLVHKRESNVNLVP